MGPSHVVLPRATLWAFRPDLYTPCMRRDGAVVQDAYTQGGGQQHREYSYLYRTIALHVPRVPPGSVLFSGARLLAICQFRGGGVRGNARDLLGGRRSSFICLSVPRPTS